ncbi:MAG: FAD-binding oxidoreductase, partial [Acidimicrobiia bacterium]|nr:FAD-binding oxidoreductase [Acidimicrobiia bacterium]
MLELLPRPIDDPWWAPVVRNFRRPDATALRGGHEDGWEIDTVVIDVKPHLVYLAQRFESLGGSIEVQRLESLDEVAADVVVNCSGVGARRLAEDEQVAPIRGQVVRVRGAAVDRVTMAEQGPMPLTYVMPHGDECILGGTTEAGEWDRVEDDEITAAILERAATLEPSLAGADVVEVRVGLRPGRPSIRLERDGRFIHNYGHAGNGWSLSWGCADEVVELVGEIRQAR